MDDEKYEKSFQLIAAAGESKSNAMMAIEAAREGEFEKAEKLLEVAEKTLKMAHGFQFQMIKEEADGNHAEANIILIHAQDYLTMAILTKERAEETIKMYKIILSLKT